jgi:hypothetical protein
MSKELKFLQCCPDDTYYVWQVHMWLESLRKIGHSDKAISLIFTPTDRKILNPKWQMLVELYPESEFNFYTDTDNIHPFLGIYVSVLRPYVLWKYFKEHPEMSSNAIFYCDSDILFTEKFDVQKFVDDDVCYLSDTASYIGAKYFDSKINDVLPDKLEEYKTRDVLAEITSVIGISRETCEVNEINSGGAQYLLKNIDTSFWNKVMNDCILIRTYLQKVNREFFENENKGFQSWCADMWAVLWNLWLREQDVLVIPELAFAWAPDPIEKLETHTIYHNAGIAGPIQDGYPAFYKAKYHQGGDPFKDQHIHDVLNSEVSKKHCTWYYANALIEMHNKYKLEY